MKAEELRKVLLEFSASDKNIIVQVLREQGYLDSERKLLTKYHNELKEDLQKISENYRDVQKLNHYVSLLGTKIDTLDIKETQNIGDNKTIQAKHLILFIKIFTILCILFFVAGGTLGWFVNSIVVYKFFTYFSITSFMFFIIGMLFGSTIDYLFTKNALNKDKV